MFSHCHACVQRTQDLMQPMAALSSITSFAIGLSIDTLVVLYCLVSSLMVQCKLFDLCTILTLADCFPFTISFRFSIII